MKNIIYSLFIFILSFNFSSVIFANELVNYEIVDLEIPSPLTSSPGDPGLGKKIAISRSGNCLACHELPNMEKLFHGNIGPSLAGVGNRYNIGELRLRIVNPYIINSNTIMPAFYKVKGLNRVDKKYLGKTILNAQEIEDIIAWLLTLKDEME